MPTQEETLAVLKQATAELDRAVGLIEPQHWALPTPCPDWTVRHLVDHLIWAEAAVEAWILGSPLELDEELIERSPVEAWRHYAAKADDVLARPGVFEVALEHPAAGTITGELLAGFRTTDRVVHGWDLLSAIGADDTLDAGLVATLYEAILPFADVLPSMGGFAERIQVPDDADLQTKLLALMGRTRTR